MRQKVLQGGRYLFVFGESLNQRQLELNLIEAMRRHLLNAPACFSCPDKQ